MKTNKLRGYLYLVSAAAAYGLFGIFSRYTNVFGPFSQGYIRYGLLCLIILLLFIFRKVTWKKINRKDVKWFLLWIIPASFQPVLTFIAFTHLAIGLTYFLLYSTMILGGILSGKIFFAEKFTFSKSLSLFLVLLGLVIIYRTDLSLVTSIYVFIALLTGLIVGFWNTLTKKVSCNYPEFQMMLLDGSSTLVVGLVGAVVAKEVLPPFTSPAPWLWIVAFTITGILSSLFLIKGFKDVEAQIGSLILPMELVFASIFSFLFIGEILKFNVYLGGSLILLAAILPAIKLTKEKS